MKRIFLVILFCILSFIGFWFSFWSSSDVKWVLSEVADNYAWSSIDTTNVKWFMVGIAKDIVMPIVIVIWLILAFVDFYELAMSDKEDKRKSSRNYLLWWTIWVIIMVSTWFIVSNLVWYNWSSWIIWTNATKDPASIAAYLYGNIIKKFFVLAMSVIIWILFVVLVISLIKFISSWDKEDMKKHTKTIIAWNSIWIFFILFAKNIVEMFYSKVGPGTQSFWDQSAILENRNLWWLSTILNYLLWFLAFIITVFIIYKSLLILLKPDDETTYKNLKKHFLYATLGVLVIWGVYIIANFLIIK